MYSQTQLGLSGAWEYTYSSVSNVYTLIDNQKRNIYLNICIIVLVSPTDHLHNLMSNE